MPTVVRPVTSQIGRGIRFAATLIASAILLVLGAALLFAVAANGGCAGNAARDQSARIMQQAWPSIMQDAEIGIQAQELPAAAQALNKTQITPGLAQAKRDHLHEYDEAMKRILTPIPKPTTPNP